MGHFAALPYEAFTCPRRRAHFPYPRFRFVRIFTRRRRGFVDEAAGASERLLFGGRLRYDLGFNRHEMAGLTLSFTAMARRLPHMFAESARLAWAADRTALVTVVGCAVGKAVVQATILLAATRALIAVFAGGPTPDRVLAALPSLAAIAAASGIAAVMTALSRAATGRLEPKVERLATLKFLRHAARVELSAIEDAQFHRLLDAAGHATTSARRIIGTSTGVINALATVVGAAGAAALLHPVLLPLLLLVAVPRGWGAVRAARCRYQSIQCWLEHTRASRLTSDLVTRQEAAQEVRVHGAGAFLLEHYAGMAATAEAEQTRVARYEATSMLTASALSGLAALVTYAALGLLLLNGGMPLAVAGAAVMAIRTTTASLSTLVMEINRLYEDALFLKDLDTLGEEADRRAIPDTGADLAPTPTVIRVEDAGFTYPNQDRPALDGVNLTIHRGQVVALVGENGSGKTTLAKLIAGLYAPDTGRITWDGVDVRDLDRGQLFDRVALVSQDFQRWPFTARANVIIGRPGGPVDEHALEEAAAYADLHGIVETLPKGWDTIIQRGFTGSAQLSGGQWQRIGLARAHYRSAALIICDEPTSALDPKAEIETFDKIHKLTAKGHTVVLITHRLASVRHADHIYVLDHGRLVEEGTHTDLLQRSGHFADLYRLQADQFTRATI
jgi:ATP-binding cassette, subfamily B, bacterial